MNALNSILNNILFIVNKFIAKDEFQNLYNKKDENSLSLDLKKNKILKNFKKIPVHQILEFNLEINKILNKLNNPIRESANAKFKILFENELIFYDPLEASKFINKMWHEDIKKWWYGEKIQKAVKEFQSEFARSTEDIVSELKKEILN